MFAKFLTLLLCPITLCAESKILEPLVVSGDKLNKRAEQVSGSVTVLGPERLAALPPSAGTYQDLLALTAGAYAGNPGVGTFSLRGLNQDNVFGYLGTGSNALINVMMDGARLSRPRPCAICRPCCGILRERKSCAARSPCRTGLTQWVVRC